MLSISLTPKVSLFQMASAVSKGLVTEATVTTAARRGLLQRFTQGDFDPLAAPPPPPPPPGSCGMNMSVSTGHFAPLVAASCSSAVCAWVDAESL